MAVAGQLLLKYIILPVLFMGVKISLILREKHIEVFEKRGLKS
jgi:hypothetical protein